MRKQSVQRLALIILGCIALLLLYVLSSLPEAGLDPGSLPAAQHRADHQPPVHEPESPVLANEPGDPVPTSTSTSNSGTGGESPAPSSPAVAGGGTGLEQLLRGVVLDERTEEPIPELTVTLACAGRRETVSTRHDGSFTASASFSGGDLVVELADLDTHIGRFERAYEPGLSSDLGALHVRIGPTFPLLIEPEDVVACSARLVESARPTGVAGVIEVRASNLGAKTMLEGLGDRDWPWVQVRPGTPPWFRYPTVPSETDDRRSPHIEVRMCRSGSEGLATVQSTVGVQPPTKIQPTIELADVSGSLQFRRSPFEHTHSSNPGESVLLLPRSTSGQEGRGTPLWYEVRPNAQGSFHFDRVKPGSWRLLAHATDHRILLQDIEVPPGSTRLPPLQLVRSETECLFDVEFPGGGVEQPGGTVIRLRLVTAGSAGRAWLQPGHLWDFPASEFELSVIGVDCPPGCRPFSARVSTPPGELDPHAVSASEYAEFSFDVRDARTDQRRNGYKVSFGPQGAVFGCPQRKPNGAWSLATDTPLSWLVWQEGYAPAFGDERSFQQGEDGRTARAELTPGWGVSLLFRVGNPASFEADPWPWKCTFPNATSLVGALACPPLRAVRVEVGQDEVASSDDEGEVRLQLREEPSRLTLRCEGWKLLGVEPSSWGGSPQYIVWMDRE
jgi:hypothetical protein